MVKQKNNPYLLLENEGITKSVLSPQAVKMLDLFDRANQVSIKHPESKELTAQADKAGELASNFVLKEVERIKTVTKNDIEEVHKKSVKKAQSKMIVEKSQQVLDDLAMCRQKLKEDRQRKRESGEIAQPKKKTLTTKLRQDLGKIVGLIPAKLKEDSDVIDRTEKALLKFLNELKEIWGINKIKPIQDELEEKFKKLHEQAA